MLRKFVAIIVAALLTGEVVYAAAGSIAICPTGKCAVQCGRVFGGEGAETANSVVETPDGGFLVMGRSVSLDGAVGTKLVKIDRDGKLMWEKTFALGRRESATTMIKTANGGFVVAGTGISEGSRTTDFSARKIDSVGNRVWEETYDDGESNETLRTAAPTSDGGVVLAGVRQEAYYKAGPKPNNVAIMKLDASGRREWAKRFGSGGVMEDVSSIRQIPDGGYIVTGSSGNNPKVVANNSVWVFRLDAAGNSVWSKMLQGTGQNFISSVALAPAEGFIMTGFMSVPKDQGDIWVLEMDFDGKPEWEELYGDKWKEEAYTMEPTPDGGYIVAGYTNSPTDAVLLKLDSGAYVVWVKTFGDKGKDLLVSAKATSDGGIIAAGQTDSFGAKGGTDFWVMKLDAGGNCIW